MPNKTDVDIAQMAPAAICSVVCRIVRMRSALKEMEEKGRLTSDQVRLFDEFIAPFSFESEILSSDNIKLKEAINKMGLACVNEDTGVEDVMGDKIKLGQTIQIQDFFGKDVWAEGKVIFKNNQYQVVGIDPTDGACEREFTTTFEALKKCLLIIKA